jgi:hypothetical protein
MQSLSKYSFWLELSENDIRNGVDNEEKRYLPRFCNDYFTIFGERISENAGCQKCISIAIARMNDFLKKDKKMENLTPKTILVLKDGYDNTEIAGAMRSNSTLTNEDVLEILKNHPIGQVWFADFGSKFESREDAIEKIEAFLNESKKAKKAKKEEKPESSTGGLDDLLTENSISE